MSWVLVGPTTWYSSVPTIHQLSIVSAAYIGVVQGHTYLTVPWGWQSDTAVIVGFDEVVDVGAGVTLCAAAHAAKSTATRDVAETMFKAGGQASLRVNAVKVVPAQCLDITTENQNENVLE
jgi:hypothetical protein